MKLIEVLRPQLLLTDYHLRRLRLIDEHNYSGVLRKVNEELAARGKIYSQEWYQEGLLALKQYYAVALLDGMNMHAVSDRVDPFWHAHILHTMQYAEFCRDTVGGFMHHEPLDHEDLAAVDHVDSLYRFTRERYDEIFTHVSDRFNPRSLAREELICVHFGITYEAAGYAIFPPHPDAQPIVVPH
jgi:hypothetical protein